MGDYHFPQFITSTIGTLSWDDGSTAPSYGDGSDGKKNENNCWFVTSPEDIMEAGVDDVWIMWQQDAYRNCLLAHPRFKFVTMNAIWEVPEGETVIYEQLLADSTPGAASATCAAYFESHSIVTEEAWTGAECIENCYASTWTAHQSANYFGVE